MSERKESIIKSIAILLISQIFIKIIGLVYKLYLTNKEGFGDMGNAIYSSGFQIYALLLTFSSTGVPSAISKLIAEKIALGDNHGADKLFKVAFISFAIMGMLGTILLFVSAKYIANELIQIPEAELSLIALAPSIFFVAISSVIRGYFNGIQKFSVTAKAQTIEQILKTVYTVVLVEVVANMFGITEKMASAANFATTLATISSFIYIFFYFKIQNKKRYKYENIQFKNIRTKDIIKDIVSIAFPISISSLISSFNKNIDSFTIVRFLKNIMTEEEAKIQYGILSGKVDSLCALAFSFNIAFVTTLVPSIARLKVIGDYDNIRRKSSNFILISLIIGLLISVIMFTFPKEIFEILFPNASSGYLYLRYSSISIIFMLLAQTVNAILQGIGKVNIPAMAFGVGLIVKFICNVILLPQKQIGIYGAIMGNIMCNVVAFLISIITLKKSLNIKFEISRFIIKPIILIGCFLIISMMLFKKVLLCIKIVKLRIIVSLMLGIFVYIFLNIMLQFSNRPSKILRKTKNIL